ncbi:tyrosine-type recombinase/integrase [Amycolatopsis sp. NPDC059090]|uniref:tyrosine-type recombinase/integrase n=1 Tax=unclassified Amycolatopsis TaxID=2618356 RepID=UPI00366AC589
MADSRRDWGRIRKLSSGRFQARYPGPDGVLRPAPDTFDTRRAASEWLAAKRTEIAQDDWVNPDAAKIGFIEYATTWVAERKLADTTRERYEGIVRNHFEPTRLGKLSLAAIKEATVRKWHSELLANEVGGPTVVKAYRLLRAIYNTAVEEDRIVKRNPCRIKGAGEDDSPERPVLTIAQAYALADAMPPRYRMLVLLATFASPRFGELAALRRRDVDFPHAEIRVLAAQSEARGTPRRKGPKSEAGKRRIAIPRVIVPDFREHIEKYAEPGADGLVFVGPQGGRLRRHNFRRLWVKAKRQAKIPDDVHFHDLRHTGNELAAEGGATTKELMARMGHSTTKAAIRYQRARRERDRAVADAMSRNIEKARQRPAGKRARKRARRRDEGHGGGTEGGTAA